MKTTLFVGCLCLVVSIGFILIGCGKGDQQAQAGTQTMCPVMGRAIDKKIYEDYKGKRVYFCCNGCQATFKANPEKYLKKMADQAVVLEDAP